MSGSIPLRRLDQQPAEFCTRDVIDVRIKVLCGTLLPVTVVAARTAALGCTRHVGLGIMCAPTRDTRTPRSTRPAYRNRAGLATPLRMSCLPSYGSQSINQMLPRLSPAMIELLTQRFFADGTAARGQLRELGFGLPHAHVADPCLQEVHVRGQPPKRS